jgi:hypothetical protein
MRREGRETIYSFWTHEKQGRRLRKFTAQPLLALREGMTITMVWRGNYLVGLADQDNKLFFNIETPVRTNKTSSLLPWLRGVIGVALILGIVQLFSAAPKILSPFDFTQLLPGLIIIGVLLILPSIWRLALIWRNEDGAQL